MRTRRAERSELAWAVGLSALAHALALMGALAWLNSPMYRGVAVLGSAPARPSSLSLRLAPPLTRASTPDSRSAPASPPAALARPRPMEASQPKPPLDELRAPAFVMPALAPSATESQVSIPLLGAVETERVAVAPPELEPPEPAAYADIEMEVAPDGRVIQAWVVDSKPLGAPFIEQALSAALKAVFEPYQPAEGERSRRRRLRAVYDAAGEEAQGDGRYKATVVDAPLGAVSIATPAQATVKP